MAPRYKRKDANHADIKRAFERLGCSVVDVSDIHQAGVFDLIVGKYGVTFWVDVKMPSGDLERDQVDFKNGWQGGPCVVARTVQDVEAIVDRMRSYGGEVNLRNV